MKGLKYYDKGIISPRFMLILSMTIFGTLGLFVRNIPVSSGELALYRAVSAAMLIFIYLKITRQKIPFQKIKKEILCFLMSTLGFVLLTGVGDTNGKSNLTGISFGLGAAVFYATVILLNKFIKQVDGIYRTFLQFLSAILSYIDPFVAVLVSVFLLGESITLLQGLGGALIL